jgi:hypothetical protein
LCNGHTGYTQDHIYVSRNGLAKVLRVNFAATLWTILQGDSAARRAVGLHLSNELKILSAFLDYENAFSVFDGFYFNFDIGKMLNPVHVLPDKKETAFSLNMSFGYKVLAGYRNDKLSALGGIDLRWVRNSVGELDMPYLNGPLLYFFKPYMLRFEYSYRKNRPEQRMALVGWTTFNSATQKAYRGLRFEIAMEKTGNWWFFTQYDFQKALVQDNFRFMQATDGRLSQLFMGFKKGTNP